MELTFKIKSLFPELPVRKNQPLNEYTTFRLGGSCPLFIDNPAADQLPELIRLLTANEMPHTIIGQGSNLVVSDGGLDCAVIRFCSETPDIQVNGTRVTVSGSTLLDDFSRFTTENEIGDLTYCTGIPGTVGGGIVGNAGAFGRQIGDHLVSVEVLDENGSIKTLSQAELCFAYRHSRLKETGGIVLSATFELPQEEQKIMQAERERILQFRRDHHPNWHETPCAGSVFRNIEPTSAVERRKAAGFFLEEAGAHRLSVGGAHIYEKHANIIVAGPGCTAQDVYTLSEQMIDAVREKFGFDLVREIRFLGSF